MELKFFLCGFLSLIRVGNFLTPFVFSFLVLGTYKLKMIGCCYLPCLASMNNKPLKLLIIMAKFFPRFAILSIEMILLSYSCIEDHAYISRGREHFISGIVTRRNHEVVDFTRSRVKNISKLTNLMKIILIEGYNGK